MLTIKAQVLIDIESTVMMKLEMPYFEKLVALKRETIYKDLVFRRKLHLKSAKTMPLYG
jgi:hypothetical protein